MINLAMINVTAVLEGTDVNATIAGARENKINQKPIPRVLSHSSIQPSIGAQGRVMQVRASFLGPLAVYLERLLN